jgi:hypothetical protein
MLSWIVHCDSILGGRTTAVTGPPPRNHDFKTRVTGGSRSPHCSASVRCHDTQKIVVILVSFGGNCSSEPPSDRPCQLRLQCCWMRAIRPTQCRILRSRSQSPRWPQNESMVCYLAVVPPCVFLRFVETPNGSIHRVAGVEPPSGSG